MSLISKLLQTVHSWRRRHVGPRTSKRTVVMMEQLDHRQLLSVNFTGNVETDFPATESPGVVVLPANPATNITPTIAPPLQSIVHVSGFEITGIRVTYTASDDTLSIGLDQPPSGNPGQGEVIAGDADDNGNDGTVNPAITAMPDFAGFQDFPDFGGSESMGIFLDLTNSGTADVVAGYSETDTRSPKEYQVAQALVNPGQPTTSAPGFGTELPQYEGNVYKVNSPAHPNLEFSITHFSQLYLAETGQPLTANSKFSIGAFGGSADDVGIGEEFFPEQSLTLGAATPPTMTCPPASPPVLINPHQNRHVNTAHPELVRVTILGSSDFAADTIVPQSVTLGGAHPLFSFTRPELKTGYLAQTFIFDGDQLNLPGGITTATVTGNLADGQAFSTSERIFVRNYSYYDSGAIAAQQARWTARGADIPDLQSVIAKYERNAGKQVIFTYTGGSVTPAGTTPPSEAGSSAAASAAIAPDTVTDAATSAGSILGTTPTVAIKLRHGGATTHTVTTPKLPTRLRKSMNAYIQSNAASVSTSAD